MRQVRARNPAEPLVLACRPGLGDFFLHEKLVDEVIPVDKSDQGGEKAWRELASRSWSYVFCPHESVRTARGMRRIRAREARVGFSHWWNFWAFDRRVPRREQFPDALRQLSLLTAIDSQMKERFEDLARGKSQDNSPVRAHAVDFSLQPLPEWASMTLRKGAGGGSRVCLAPGSVWATKRWKVSGFVELGRDLKSMGWQVCLVGAPAERELCGSIADQIGEVENLAGRTTLTQMVDLFCESRALVTNDSGAMHMASVAGLPTVAIFGPTTLEWGYRPWQDKATVVQTEVSCRPCGKHGAKLCPVGNHRCMNNLNAARVLAALQKYL